MNVIVNNQDAVELPLAEKALLHVVCPDAQVHNIEYPGRVRIDLAATTYHAERVRKLHAEARKLIDQTLARFYSRKNGVNLSPRNWYDLFQNNVLQQAGTGICHIVGLIDLSLKLQDQKIPYVLVHPESGLHPAIVLELTDVLIELAIRGGDENLYFERLTKKAVIPEI